MLASLTWDYKKKSGNSLFTYLHFIIKSIVCSKNRVVKGLLLLFDRNVAVIKVQTHLILEMAKVLNQFYDSYACCSAIACCNRSFL